MTGSDRRAAFFDLDNTLLHGAALFLIGRGMHAHGVVSTRDLLRGAWQQVAFRVVGERSTHLRAVRDRGLALGTGIEVEPTVALGERIFDELIAPRILARAVTLAQAHLDRGEDVYIVTAAPVELARIVARRLEFTDALGTVSEVVQGRWTGRLVGAPLHGPAKADAVRALAADRGYTLAHCAAYSDSANDLPLLEAVGHPHAVNPDRRLRAIATERGWQVHDFRVRRHTSRAVLAVGSLAVAGGALVALRRHPDWRAATLTHAAAFTAGARTGYRQARAAVARHAITPLTPVTVLRTTRSSGHRRRPAA